MKVPPIYPQNQAEISCLGISLKLKGDKIIKNAPLYILAIPIVTGLGYLGKAMAKDGYEWMKKKFAEKRVDSNKLLPKVQSLGDVRSEVGCENFSDGQLVGNLIYQRDIVILYGEAGIGKSVLALQLAEAIATGGKSFVTPDDNDLHKPQSVIYYDGEMDEADYQKIYGNQVIDVHNLTLIRGFFFNDTQEWLQDLKLRLKCITANVAVFVDNLSCITSTTGGNVIRQFFLNDLKAIQEEFHKHGGELTFVFLAHTNKEGELAGTQNLNNFGTAVLGLASTEKPELLSLNVDKNRKYGDMKGKTFILQKKQTIEGRKFMEVLVETKCAKNDKDKDGEAYYNMRNTGMTDKEIADQVGCTRETVNKKINAYMKNTGVKK